MSNKLVKKVLRAKRLSPLIMMEMPLLMKQAYVEKAREDKFIKQHQQQLAANAIQVLQEHRRQKRYNNTTREAIKGHRQSIFQLWHKLNNVALSTFTHSSPSAPMPASPSSSPASHPLKQNDVNQNTVNGLPRLKKGVTGSPMVDDPCVTSYPFEFGERLRMMEESEDSEADRSAASKSSSRPPAPPPASERLMPRDEIPDGTIPIAASTAAIIGGAISSAPTHRKIQLKTQAAERAYQYIPKRAPPPPFLRRATRSTLHSSSVFKDNLTCFSSMAFEAAGFPESPAAAPSGEGFSRSKYGTNQVIRNLAQIEYDW